MKLIRKVSHVLTLTLFLTATDIGFSQSISAPDASVVQNGVVQISATDVPALHSLSEEQLTAFVNVLNATPTLTPAALPLGGNVGTFWSLQNPTWPPLPFDTSASSVWPMSDGGFLLNDATYDYNAPTSFSSRRMGAMEDEGGGMYPPGYDGSGTNDYTPFGSSYTTPDYGTNLWLEIITVTNQTASLVIHPSPAETNEVYDLLYCTNLLPPIAWQWLLRSYPDQTNLIVPNANDAQGFYRLGPPDDLTANSSLGTNFWLMFPYLNSSDNNNDLSLIISSPVGAIGTIDTPGLIVNGPTLTVTNCGDLALDGNYMLTNLTEQEKADFGVPGPAYVFGTNWVVYEGGNLWILLTYDSDERFADYLYNKNGINLNGSATDWQANGDTNVPSPTTLCLQVPLINQIFTVTAGGVTNISIPPTAMLFDYDRITTNGIHITTSQPASVYGLNYSQFSSTAFTGYPSALLGTNYCIMARAVSVQSPENGYYSQFSIMAVESNTTITIIPSASANLDGYTNFYTLTNLQTGATYQINSKNETDDDATNDVTGTWVTSDRPIAVFAGASGAYVPDGTNNWGNPLMQEQMPVDSWGKEALSMGFAGRVNGDSYRVLAAYTNTVVSVNGIIVGTNQAGQFLDLILDGPVQFQASQPIQVAHFSNGTDFDSQEGDPCEILLPPIGHYLMTNIIVSPTGLDAYGSPYAFDKNYLSIIISQLATNSTYVDNSLIAITNYVAVGNSGYYGAQISVTNGVHTVTSSQPVGVEVYGFGVQDAYGYFGGIIK